MTYKRAHTVPWRIVDGKAVLVVVKNSEVIVLNGLGTDIWKFLSEERTEDDIVEYLYENFDAGKDAIRNDARAFVISLKDKEVLNVR